MNKMNQTFRNLVETTVDQYKLYVKACLRVAEPNTGVVGEEVKGSGFECGRVMERQQA